MKIPLAFPEGHDMSLERDRVIKLKGITDKTLKGKKVILRGFTDLDIIEIRQMLIDEIKEQIKEEEVENVV